MRGSILPAALLCAALGLMLAFGPRRIAAAGTAVLILAGLVATQVVVPLQLTEGVFLACWAITIAITACIYLPRPVPSALALALAGVAGIAAGLTVRTESTAIDLVKALPAVLIVLPSAFAIRRGYRVAPRVIGSWLIAVSLLAATIPLVTVHPGYVPDHRE